MINYDYDKLLKWLYERDRKVFDDWVMFCQEESAEYRKKISRDNRMLNHCLKMYKMTFPDTPQHIVNAIDLINHESNLPYEDKMPAIRALLHEEGGIIFRGSGNYWGQWKREFEVLLEEEE